MLYKSACCLPKPIILPVAKSCKTQPCGKRTTQQFSALVILLTDTRFKLKEGTQRTSLRVIFSLNLIMPVDEMVVVEPVGRLTFGINDDEVCEKNCESDVM